MKKGLFIFALGLLFSIQTAVAQKHLMDSEVPQNVMKLYKQMYADAADSYWTDNTENYKVGFKLDDFPYEAFYTFEGKWIKTESLIDAEEMPEIIIQAINATHKNKDIGTVKRIDFPERKRLFSVELYDVAYNSIIVVYDDKGNQLK